MRFYIITIITFLFFTSNFFASYAQVNLQQGLQLYLPFSGNATDASGNNNNAIVNGATLTTDEFGNANSAYLFNGISDFMEIASTNNLQCKDSISICAKVFVSSFYGGSCQNNVILTKKLADQGNGHYSLRYSDAPFDIDCNSFNPTYENFYGQLNNLGSNFPNGTNAGQVGAPPYINTNQWYCVIYTWSGDTIKLYVNGIKKYQYAYTGNNGISSENLFIGKRNDATDPYYMHGKLDEIRIYNRALRSQEIGAYCNGCQAIQAIPNFISTADSSICVGKSMILKTASNLAATYKYKWWPSGTLSNDTSTTVLATPINTTTYTLQISDTIGCVNYDSIKITMNPLPTIFAGTDTSFCPGYNVQLQAVGNGSFSWLPSAGLSNASIANPICNINTTYTVALTNANGCTAFDTINITIAQNPTILIPAQYYYCTGALPIQLTTGGAGSFLWMPSTGLSANNVNNPFASPNITTIYTVTLTSANNCSASSVVTISVNPSPIISVSNTDTICYGSSTNLQANGASSYFWNPAATLNNASIANPIATPIGTTIYTVTGANSFNCSVTSTVQIVVSPNINLQIVSTPDSTFCLGDSVQLIAYGGTSYTWSPMANTNIISNNSVKIWPTNSTTYTVIAQNDFGCADTNTYYVVVQKPPIVTATKSADIDCEQKTINLYANGAIDYEWINNGTLSANSGNTVMASPTVNTTYTVTGIEGKCRVTATVQVLIEDEKNKKIYIPNAITMNGDGINDGFQIKSSIDFKTFELRIYNRYGEQVFISNNINKIWYGEHKGNEAKLLDSYFYYFNGSDACGEIVRKGDVLVVR